MSIVTKTGDQGITALMYQRRVPKTHPRIEACGAVDELNAALGLARAAEPSGPFQNELASLQKDLIALMGELATAHEDLPRYDAQGLTRIGPAMTGRLEEQVAALEAHSTPLHDWATPGANLKAAALDLARTTCRRAERRVCALKEAGELTNPEIIPYLNRLSDLLWLMARCAETIPQAKARKGKAKG